eukprot:2432405-Amphidinium_carterae.1
MLAEVPLQMNCGKYQVDTTPRDEAMQKSMKNETSCEEHVLVLLCSRWGSDTDDWYLVVRPLRHVHWSARCVRGRPFLQLSLHCPRYRRKS